MLPVRGDWQRRGQPRRPCFRGRPLFLVRRFRRLVYDHIPRRGEGKRRGGVGCPRLCVRSRSRSRGLSWRVVLVIFAVFGVRSRSCSCPLALGVAESEVLGLRRLEGGFRRPFTFAFVSAGRRRGREGGAGADTVRGSGQCLGELAGGGVTHQALPSLVVGVGRWGARRFDAH